MKFVPGPENTNTYQVSRKHHGDGAAEAAHQLGGDPKKPNDEGALIWDIGDPVNWKLLSHWKTGANGIHRIGYPSGNYFNAAATMPGYRGQILVFVDIGDISYPKQIGELPISPPFGVSPAHDVPPIPGEPLLFLHGEATGGGDEPDGSPAACSSVLTIAATIDIKNEARPRLMSIFPTPVPPKNAPYTDFFDKGGRFGPHNTNLEYHLPDVEKQADLIYLTYFNAGLRIFDIKDPVCRRRIPPTPTKRYGPLPYDKLVNQIEDALVDPRGNIYITDKNWGVFVLRYTGKGEPAATATK